MDRTHYKKRKFNKGKAKVETKETTNNSREIKKDNNNATHNFEQTDIQNFYRLLQLFPSFHPVGIMRVFQQTNKDFVRCIDNFLYANRYISFMEYQNQMSTTAFYSNSSQSGAYNSSGFNYEQNLSSPDFAQNSSDLENPKICTSTPLPTLISNANDNLIGQSLSEDSTQEQSNSSSLGCYELDTTSPSYSSLSANSPNSDAISPETYISSYKQNGEIASINDEQKKVFHCFNGFNYSQTSKNHIENSLDLNHSGSSEAKMHFDGKMYTSTPVHSDNLSALILYQNGEY